MDILISYQSSAESITFIIHIHTDGHSEKLPFSFERFHFILQIHFDGHFDLVQPLSVENIPFILHIKIGHSDMVQPFSDKRFPYIYYRYTLIAILIWCSHLVTKVSNLYYTDTH